MQQSILQNLPLIAFGSLMSSAVGALAYGTCRWQEKYQLWSEFAESLNGCCTIVLGGFALMLALWEPTMRTPIFLYIVVSAVGGWLHLKSGGYSGNLLNATKLMATAIFVSYLIGVVAANVSMHLIPWPGEWLGFPFLIGLLLYPVLAPLALWLYRSARVRPGIDEPFSKSAEVADL